jgi:hypothetical protein
MAGKNGGARPGAGRKPGVSNRPQLRDYYTPEERDEVINRMKARALVDDGMLKFVGEQLFGKAAQQLEVSGPEGEPLSTSLSASDRKAITELRDLLKQRSA